MDDLKRRSGVRKFTLHDLRRTAATKMAQLGVPVHVIEAILNNKSGTISGVAAIYNRYNYETEKREALEQWAKHATGLAQKIKDSQLEL